MRTVIEKDIDVALGEVHGANARRGAAEMVAGGIARRIGFGFDDASADAPIGKIVDDYFADEEACKGDGVFRQFRAAEAADRRMCVEFFQGCECLWIGRVRRFVVEEAGEFGVVDDHRGVVLDGVEVFFLECVAGFRGHEHFAR